MDTKVVERVAKALSDRNRLLILQKIAKQKCLGCTQAQGIVTLAQPTLSHHVKVLVDAGLVDSHKDGRNLNLYLNRERVQELIDFLSQLNHY